MYSDPQWQPGGTPEERAARQAAYQRLRDAARRAGLPLERLAAMLRQVAHNEETTRRFLAEQVYGVADAELDELLRARLADPRPPTPDP